MPTLTELLAAKRAQEQSTALASPTPLSDALDTARQEPTWGDTLVTGAARFGLPIVGGLVGSTADFFVGPFGTIAGGAAGGAAGETLAEMWEKARGIRKDVNLKQVGVQAGLAAIPLPGVGKGASVLKSALTHGAMGGVMGGVGTAATELAETGQLPSAGQMATGVGAGALLSGAIGGALAKAPKPAGAPSVVPELEAMRQKRLAAATKPETLLDKLQQLPRNLRRRYEDQWIDLRKFDAKGQYANVEQRPSNVVDVEYGGGGGRIEQMHKEVERLRATAEGAGLTQPVTDYLDIKGLQHAERTLRQRAIAMLRDPDPAVRREGFKLGTQLTNGELLPEGFTGGKLRTREQDLQQSLGPRWQEVVDIGTKQFDMNRHYLDALHAEGIISDKVHTELIGRGHDYVPIPRIMEDAATSPHAKFGAIDLKSQKVLYHLEGSKRTTENPWGASFERNQEAIKEVSRNKMARTVAELPTVDPIFGPDIRELKGHETPRKGYGQIKYYRDGQNVTVEVPQAIADAFERANSPQGTLPASALFQAIRAVAQPMMTTLNPGFAVTNLIRDIQDVRKLNPDHIPINLANPMSWAKGAKDLGGFMKEWGQALKQAYRETPEFQRFQNAGGDYSGLQKNISPETFLNPQEQSLASRLLSPLAKANNLVETAPKLASFNRALKNGATDFEAALRTRNLGGSPDFARKGTHGHYANQLAMFFNAQVQGTARNLRAFDPRVPGNLAKLGGVAASAAVANAALYNWNRQFVDSDGTPSYDRINDADKQTNWVILDGATYTDSNGTERHSYIKVPKGHINRLIHNPIAQAIEAIGAQLGGGTTNKATFGQAALDIASNVIPGSVNLKQGDILQSLERGGISSLNPALGVPLEWTKNQDTYRNVPIEAKHLEGVDVTERAGRNTSPTMVGLSKMLDQAGLAKPLGASPQKLQHAVTSVVPGLGESALSVIDRGLKGASPIAYEGDEKLGRLPVVGPVLRRFVGSPLDQVEATRTERFYNALEQSNEAAKTYANFKQLDPQKAAVYGKQNQALLGLNRKLTPWAKALSDIRKFRERIALNPPPDAASQMQMAGQREAALLKQIDAALDQLLPQ